MATVNGGKIQGAPWTFTQLGPPNKVFKLEGPNAPHGRPRKGAVMTEELELRASVTYYAQNNVPDRHVFGTKHAPIVLTGRFMDSRIGAAQGQRLKGIGGAQAKWDEMSAFVNDQVPVQVQWGGIFAATGLITKCSRGAESAEEFTYSLTMELDKDDTKPVQAPTPPPVNVSDQVATLAAIVFKVNATASEIPEDIEYQPSFLDSLHNTISTINSASAALSNFADSVDNYESALSADVASFRAGIAQYGKAVYQLQVTLDCAENDPAIVAARGSSQTTWFQQRAQMTESLLEVLGILASMDSVASFVQHGNPDKTYTVLHGDTLESIALSQLGSASQTGLLRDANSIRYGTQPTPGSVLHIPKQS